jgi:dephospho-CoA kinase
LIETPTFFEASSSTLARSKPAKAKPVIGLAGGIGAGKSSVAHELERLGAAVLDFDRLAHEQLVEPEVLAKLQAWWGDRILDSTGRVDRAALATIVFNDPNELGRLEGLLYPRLMTLCQRRLQELKSIDGVRAIVLDAPKLYEAGLDRLCNAVVFVEADRSLRLARVGRSRGWDEAELDRRENLQKPLDKKKACADYVVVNHSGAEHLRSQVERVFNSVLASFSE